MSFILLVLIASTVTTRLPGPCMQTDVCQTPSRLHPDRWSSWHTVRTTTSLFDLAELFLCVVDSLWTFTVGTLLSYKTTTLSLWRSIWTVDFLCRCWPRSISGEFRILIKYVVSYSSVVLTSLHSFDKWFIAAIHLQRTWLSITDITLICTYN